MRARLVHALTSTAFGLGLTLAACESSTDPEEVQRSCPCIPVSDDDDRMSSTPAMPDCGSELCPVIRLSLGGVDEYMFNNPEAIDCALEALRDGTPGLLRWQQQNDDGNTDGYLLIQDDGTLVRRTWGLQDLAWVIDEALLGDSRPSSDFEACLANPDTTSRYDCVRNAQTSTSLTCDTGWIVDVI